MSIKDNKLKDLTPLNVSYLPGESPTAEKLKGMMTQVQVALEYLENSFGDAFGEDEKYNTWMSTLARDIGDRSELNPSILPNHVVDNYSQNLILGNVEHELDMTPVGELADLIVSSLDAAVVATQYKNTVAELEEPGDWTIASGYIENGKHKRSRKLVTHSPSEGGQIILSQVTSGRGSSLESTLENIIPNLAQANASGSFIDLVLADAITNTYLVTLPLREKMYDKTNQIIDFSASNITAQVGLNSQYELPPVFFGNDGLALDQDDPIEGGGKVIPLNLIKLYDWNTKKQIDGIVRIQASPVPEARTYQFLVQMQPDVLLNVSTGSYLVVVPGNTITSQIKALSDIAYNNNGSGLDMARLIAHKNLTGLRTGSVDYSNRSKYYGPSIIDANDHSQYLHRNGFTNSDKGAGGNILRGDLVVGSKALSISDLEHEHYNVSDDSFKLMFGNSTQGGSVSYDKIATHDIDHSYGGLPLSWSDNALLIEGSASDADPSKKNIIINGNLRTIGNVILGRLATDIIFMQGKVYINDELTMIPHVKAGITGEEGKIIYDPTEKALLVHNGFDWSSTATQLGYTVVVGNGVSTFGKYNGTSIAPFNLAIAEVVSKGGGTIKVLDGTYNFLTNTLIVPANIALEGSGPKTSLVGSNITLRLQGDIVNLGNFSIEGTNGAVVVESSNSQINHIVFKNSIEPIRFAVTASGSRLGSNVSYVNCTKTPVANAGSTARTSLVVSAGYFPPHGNGIFDWSRKEDILRELSVTSGNAVVTYNSAGYSAVGTGRFEITGNGTISSHKYLPVSPKLGIGGHICISCSAAAQGSFGVEVYDASHNLIDTKMFVINSQALTTGTLEDQFFKNLMVNGVGSALEQFLATARYVKPIISITANTGTVYWDMMDIQPLNYSRAATWG